MDKEKYGNNCEWTERQIEGKVNRQRERWKEV